MLTKKISVLYIISTILKSQHSDAFSFPRHRAVIRGTESAVEPFPKVSFAATRLPTSETDTFAAENVPISPAAQWHQSRRREILSKHSSEILPLEQQSHGLFVGLPLLFLSNVALLYLSIQCAVLSMPYIILLAFPASVFSLWQLQILHDALHSSLLPKPSWKGQSKAIRAIIKHRKKLQNAILFWGSIPSAFGYYLYLKYGHLTHHKSLGDTENVSLAKLFNSTKKYFEDGDVLFTAHRMKILGEIGPTFHINWPQKLQIKMSISRFGFSFWREGNSLRNSLAFISSFMLERLMLILNDFVVAIAGKNFFFPNKPKDFHKECAQYCRIAVLFRLALCAFAKSWKPLLFLYLAETLWSIPPHPACAMFITNHGSSHKMDGKKGCIPSSSTYAGRWYSFLTLGTNYHVEHHDFPTIPLHELGKLRKIAPEFYRAGERDNIYSIMKKTFAHPQFYACMNSNINM
jgi:Fatty acid desaturase